tara:strand:- start:5554 stop:6621 length:1068 start_codon:yes stop_codon:yes gene_type:complete
MSLSLETIDNSFLLFVRSKEVVLLDSNLNSNLKIDLQAGITRNNPLQDIHLQLNSCEIPHSFYNFSPNLNNINLFVDGSLSLALTGQHYDIYQLIAFITAASFPYSATFDIQTNKITLTNTDSTSHTINFGESSSQKLATALGFNNVDVTVGSGGSITSNNSINLNTIHSIFVHTNLPVSNVITTTQGNLRTIIQKIPVKTKFGEVINYNPYENGVFSGIINKNEINSLELSLRDQNDILIDFNNVNFEISLLFEIHQKELNNVDRRSLPIPIPLPNIDRPSTPRPIRPFNPANAVEEIPVSNIGSFSNPKPNPIIEIPEQPIDKIEEDKILSDNFKLELQRKLTNLELLDDILN